MKTKFGIIDLSIAFLIIVAALATANKVMAQEAPALLAAHTGSAAQMSLMINQGATADSGTTALGLSLGFHEANPVGLTLVPVKFLFKLRISRIEDGSGLTEVSAQFAGVQFGAAAANICTLAIGNPLATVGCLALGMAFGYDRVKSLPIAQDCVDQHMVSFQQAADSGRVYRLNTLTCTGRFENAPQRRALEAAAPAADDTQSPAGS